MSYVLTEEQELIQQNAREFSQEYIEPIAVEIDHDYKYPEELVEQLAENGFLGMCFPEDFGGVEAGYLSYVLSVEEIAKVSGGAAAILVNHASLAAMSINKFASDELKEQYLPAMCAGEKLGAFAWAEPNHAPGAGPDRLVAAKEGDSYVLNGSKSYVMNGGVAGVYVVIAKTDLDAGTKGFSAFVVNAASAGLSVERNIKNMGLRACQCAELKFDNVKIPAGNLLSFEGGGMDLVKYVKAMANIAEGALAVGLAKAALTEASNYAKQRIQFKRPISSFPAMQTLMADIATNIHMAKLAIYDAASLVEQDERFVVEAAMVKKFVSRIGTQALIDAIQVEGGVGFCEDMSAARLYRDVNGVLLSDSSEEFPEAVIAAEILV